VGGTCHPHTANGEIPTTEADTVCSVAAFGAILSQRVTPDH
jgi:hypothetical protein